MPVPGGGALVRFELPQGPQVWAQIDPAGEIAGITPFFATGAPYGIAITGIGEDPEEPLDGWIDGWLEPREGDEPYSGAFPLRTSLVDFAVVRNRITNVSHPRPSGNCRAGLRGRTLRKRGGVPDRSRRDLPPSRGILRLSGACQHRRHARVPGTDRA